jgi:2-iminobutanoate/2-iminopropanoate deaminase
VPRTIISTDAAPTPQAGYSQAVMAHGLIFTAGAGPHDPVTGEIIGDDVRAQTRATLANLRAILATQGADLASLVKVTVHLADLKRDFLDFDAEYREWVPDPRPSRTTVGSQLWNILVEIDVVALAGETTTTSEGEQQ